MKKLEADKLDIIIPITLECDWPTKETIIKCIIEQNKKYGFKRFALDGPSAGWRSFGFPPVEEFEREAKLFKEVRDELLPYGIDCGWWITTTVKSGRSPEFKPMIKMDGSETPFSSCVLDKCFQKKFSERIALFAKIAKPSFIITEDDYSVKSSTFGLGCFCEYHLNVFEKKCGKLYTREELVAELQKDTPDAINLHRQWKEVIKESLVELSTLVRKELDKESPEIPMGYMQAGSCDDDGDVTLAISKALAGPNHTPFSRIHGSIYGGCKQDYLPQACYHALYSRQHINGDFIFYYESDTFPHNRFYTSGRQMRTLMGTSYSYGFDGSTFQTQQLLDVPNEETAYGTMFAEERNRFNEVSRIAKKCNVKGVTLPYDPFYNTLDPNDWTEASYWVRALAHFGIPYTTTDSNIVFLDKRNVKYVDDKTIMNYLKGNVFLDGEAAKILSDRGFSEYIGVKVGEDIASVGKRRFDLGAREVIRDEFVEEGNGRNMPSAHMLAPGGNGKALEIMIIDNKTEVISDACTFQREPITPAMTRFENKLGGKVVVMGLTLERNESQALFNYRRQRLIQKLMLWCDDSVPFVKEAAKIFVVMNEPKDINEDFIGMLTLSNLGEDNLKGVQIHLPEKWKNAKGFYSLDIDGNWNVLNCDRTDDGITIMDEIMGVSQMYILAK